MGRHKTWSEAPARAWLAVALALIACDAPTATTADAGRAADAGDIADTGRPIALTATPATLELDPGASGAQTVTLVARPAVGRTIQAARLTVLPAPGFGVELLDEPAAERFPTADELTWIARITADPATTPAATEVTQTFRVDYRSGEADRAYVELVTVTTKARALPRAKDVVETALLKDFDSLFDLQRARAYLRISNLTDAPVTVTGVQLLHPAFLAIAMPEPATPWTIPARGTVVNDLEISFIDDPEQPLRVGVHNLGAVISLEQLDGAERWTGQTAVEGTVTVGVPGLTEVQSLVQVPSFLLLPGVLVLAAMALMWRLFAWLRVKPAPAAAAVPPAGPAEEAVFPLSARTPEFWVVAVSLSIVVIAVYPLVTRWLEQPRNVLLGYGLRDVVYVWVGSILLGIGAFLLIATVVWVWRAGNTLWRARTAITKDDEVLTVLTRLQRLGLPMKLPWVTQKDSSGADHDLYRTGIKGDDESKEWALPTARVSAVDTVAEAQFLAELDDVVATGDAAKTLEKLAEPRRLGRVRIKWDKWGGHEGPRLVDPQLFVSAKPDQPFVKVE